MSTLTASDLRQVLCLSTQPALIGRYNLMLGHQVTHLVTSLKEDGVTLRRLENAMTATGLYVGIRDQLRQAWTA